MRGKRRLDPIHLHRTESGDARQTRTVWWTNQPGTAVNARLVLSVRAPWVASEVHEKRGQSVRGRIARADEAFLHNPQAGEECPQATLIERIHVSPGRIVFAASEARC